MKFTVKFKTLGMTLVAGEVEADRVENAKLRATDLIERRHLKNIEYSAIVATDGSEAALMNVDRFNRPAHQVEWLTVHK